MKTAVAKEILAGEERVAALPETITKYIAMGHTVDVEASAGAGVYVSDSQYEAAGAHIISDPEELFAQADLMLKVKQPHFNERVGKHEAQMLRAGSMLIAFLHPAAPANHGMIRMLQDRNITAFTMDGIPRISRAQRMDALTSMSTITGYKSVILAASHLPRFIPLLGTAIGMNPAARVLVIGAGVVGLQAIATAKALGGQVSVVDIREDARQAGRTLGASVVGFDVPAGLAIGANGSARSLPAEWLDRERQALAPGPTVNWDDDIVRRSTVIRAGKIVHEGALKAMRPAVPA